MKKSILFLAVVTLFSCSNNNEKNVSTKKSSSVRVISNNTESFDSLVSYTVRRVQMMIDSGDVDVKKINQISMAGRKSYYFEYLSFDKKNSKVKISVALQDGIVQNVYITEPNSVGCERFCYEASPFDCYQKTYYDTSPGHHVQIKEGETPLELGVLFEKAQTVLSDAYDANDNR